MIITNIINIINKNLIYITCLGAVCLLVGCEASLKLDGVASEYTKASIRTDHYQKMIFNEGVVTLVGTAGVILSSRDEGQSWQRQILTGAPEFIGLTSCPDQSLLALSFDRQVWLSGDQGSSWQARTIPTPEDLVAIHCAPDGSWWAAGSFTTLLHSSDQGQSWNEHSLDEDALITHVQFFDAQVGIATAEFGLCFKTTDGGQQWDLVGNIGQELYPLAVYFQDQQTGWVGGLSGVIMHTRDGGQSWTKQDSGVESPIYSFFHQGDQVYASGDHATVLTLRDGQWQRIEAPNIPVYLSTGQVLPNQQLLVAGGWGTLLKLPISLAQR